VIGFKCDRCGWLGFEDDPEPEPSYDRVDSGTGVHAVALPCPGCSAEELREVALCEDCGENGTAALATVEDYCEGCAARHFDDPEVADCETCGNRPGTRTVRVYGIETWVCDHCLDVADEPEPVRRDQVQPVLPLVKEA
jgi:hypothetical protein